MNTRKVAKYLLNELPMYSWKDIHACKETTCQHLLWMLHGITEGYIQHEKAHRWIGYVQGVLCAYGFTTVEEMKRLNDTRESEAE